MVQRTCCVLLALSAGCHAVRMVDTEADFREGTGAASAWSVSPSLAGKEFPALCDPVLVKEGCKAMDLGHTGETMTSLEEISETLSSTMASTVRFLTEIGIQVVGDDKVETLLCSELCQKTRDAVGAAYLPPVSDVGCHSDNAAGAVCDIDLSPQALQAAGYSLEGNEFHEGHPILENEAIAPANLQVALADLTVEDSLSDVSTSDALMRMANLFRMYPFLSISVKDDVEESDEEATEEAQEEDEDELPPALLQSMEARGGDCSGCFKKLYCSYESCKPCPICGGNGGSPASTQTPSPYPPYVRPNAPSSYPPYVPPNNHVPSSYPPYVRPNNPPPYVRPNKPGTGDWKNEVEQVNVKAQAYVASAIRRGPTDSFFLKRWMGEETREVRAKVMSVLNSLTSLLKNVEYQKGARCEGKMFAYVYPSGKYAKTSDGKFIFFLCDHYFRSREGEQIATLTHEGSHHATSLTDDVCTQEYDRDGKCIIAYGRRTCMEVASNHPDWAQKNADNYCYYINQINGDT